MVVSHNPFTLAITYQGTYDTVDALKNKLAVSKKVHAEWSKVSLPDRKLHFEALADLMESQKQQLSELITIEMGKPILESISEIEKCIALVRWYTEQAVSFLESSTALEMSPQQAYSYIEYKSIGTILGIMPWNFPFWQVFRFVIPTLLVGNTVIVKHASNVQGCATVMQKLFEDAGFRIGTFLSAFTSRETIETVISSPIIQGISLTGSEKAGRTVAALAGAHLKKCVLELGGSDPFIVLADADIENSITQAIKSRASNAGQSCIAAKRFIIHADCYDTFIQGLATAVSRLHLGDPLSHKTTMGPMARRDLKEELVQQVDESIKMGASIYYKHPFNDVNSNFFAPILLENAPADSPARKDELFGPVFTCIKVQSEQEAIDIANETSFGLGASIWSADVAHAKQLTTRIESGSVFINDMVRSDARIPFGGIKNSGYGRELSIYGMHEFVNIKTHWVAGRC